MKSCLHKTLFYSLFTILAAQFSMNLFIADFKISMGIICFSVLLFMTEDFPLLPAAGCSAAGVFLIRLTLYWFKNGRLDQMPLAYMPEIAFYISYGLLLYLYIRLHSDFRKHIRQSLLVLFFVDYAANLCELLLRLRGNVPDLQAQTGILLVALFRVLIIGCILMTFRQYRLFLLKQEHEERYKRLLLLISRLNGEIVWMKKNTALIEDTMSTAYQLYRTLKELLPEDPLYTQALSVAKDIHEIKKEYFLIMRGISEALDQELESDGMYLDDIFRILHDFLRLTAAEQKKSLDFSFFCRDSLYTEQHYALLSVFRNLSVNALEAGISSPVSIQISQTRTESSDAGSIYVFTITDNGPGIPEEYRTDIFKAGFSTKINCATGEINRGLGLNLVKDLIETQLKGRITLTSVPGRTTFTIQIPERFFMPEPRSHSQRSEYADLSEP